MRQVRRNEPDTRIRQAMAELQDAIASHYPVATFTVGPGGENEDGVYLTVQVDLDDPDVVLDLVVDRVLELQFEKGLPIHVTPIRTPERVAAMASQLSPQLAAKGFFA